MLLFAHLCIGAIAGLYLYRATKVPGMVAIATVAALLPDLIDKPLEVLWGGRFGQVALFHTFLVFVILGLIGIIVLLVFRSPVPAVVAGMVGLHQVVDLLWLNPQNWFYPFLGAIPESCPCPAPSLPAAAASTAMAIPVEAPGHFLLRSVMGEVLSPSEWVFLLVLVLLLFSPTMQGKGFRWGAGLLALLAVGAIAPAAGLPIVLAAEDGLAMERLLLVVAAVEAVALWHYGRLEALDAKGREPPGSPTEPG